MKPIFGIDCTQGKDNEQVNGSEFLVQRVSPALEQAFEKVSDETDTLEDTTKLPLGLRIAQYVTGAVGWLLAFCLFLPTKDVTLSQAYQNAPALFWVCGVCLPVWGVLKFLAHRKQKAILAQDSANQTLSRADGVMRAIYTELGVPEDAVDVDVLMFFYKEKDGKIKFTETPLQLSTCFNPAFKLYTDDEHFYLANLEGKYAFPLSCIGQLQEVKKRISVPEWNKDVPYNKGIYKPYKLTVNNMGMIFCKSYYILHLQIDGEDMGIYFPSYDLPAFEKLIKKI